MSVTNSELSSQHTAQAAHARQSSAAVTAAEQLRAALPLHGINEDDSDIDDDALWLRETAASRNVQDDGRHVGCRATVPPVAAQLANEFVVVVNNDGATHRMVRLGEPVETAATSSSCTYTGQHEWHTDTDPSRTRVRVAIKASKSHAEVAKSNTYKMPIFLDRVPTGAAVKRTHARWLRYVLLLNDKRRQPRRLVFNNNRLWLPTGQALRAADEGTLWTYTAAPQTSTDRTHHRTHHTYTLIFH